jgi:hypothetical protein
MEMLIGIVILLVFVLPVVSVIVWLRASNRLDTMEGRVSQLTARLGALESVLHQAVPRGTPRPEPTPQPQPTPVAPRPASAPVAPPAPPTPAAPPPVAARPWTPPVPPPGPAFASSAVSKRSSEEWETLLGGNWLNKIGVLVLVIGIALLLGYSFTHMGPAGIVGISLAGSAAMLVAGVVFEPRERYRIFARGLIGGGWAALYITVYSMHAVAAAKVVENPYLAGILLIAVAAGMIVHSLKYRSETVTGLAYFTAFLTLVLTQITSLSLISLVPLAASLLYLAHRFQWSRMALGGLIATYVTVALRPDTGAPLWEAQTIFAVYWLLFEAFDILQADSWLLPLNAAGFLGLSLIKWQRADPQHLWKLLVAVAAAYLVSAVLRARRGRWQGAATLTAALGAAAIFQRLDHQWAASALVVEAELFYLAGLRLRAPYLRWLGSGLFGLEAGRLGADVANLPVDAWAPVAALDAVVFYANRFLCAADLFYGYAAAAAVALMVGFKAPDQYRGLWWLLTALVPCAFGWWRRLADIRLHGYLLWGLGLAGVAFELGNMPLSVAVGVSYALALCGLWSQDGRMGGDERESLRVLGSLAATAALAALAWRMVGGGYLGIVWIGVGVMLMELGFFGWPSEMRGFATALAALGAGRVLINDILSLQNHGLWIPRLLPAAASLLAYWIAYRWWRIEGAVGPVASWTGTAFLAVSMWAVLPPDGVAAAWALYSVALLAAGFRWNQPQLPAQSCALGSVAYCWWLVNLLDRSGAAPASALLGCAGAIVCFYGAQLLAPRGHILRLYFSLLAGTLTSLLLYNEISGRMLTIAWGIQGVVLLAAGFPLRDHIPRLSGLALLLFCILKLFVYDLSYLDTLPRIFSFLGLGLILVAVSWVYTRFRERVAKYL